MIDIHEAVSIGLRTNKQKALYSNLNQHYVSIKIHNHLFLYRLPEVFYPRVEEFLMLAPQVELVSQKCPKTTKKFKI